MEIFVLPASALFPISAAEAVSMKMKSSVATIEALKHSWESLLDLESVSEETKYRIRRLIDRAAPLEGKMFVKTIKGKEMIAQCAEKTCAVRDRLESRRADVYVPLTDLERTYEEFLKLVYEFRVKAG
jgi:hypothetical protein